MQFIILGIKLAAFTIWADLRAWRYLPQAIWISISGGGLFRLLWRTLTGFRYLQKKGLPAYSNDLEGDKIHFLHTGSSDAVLLESEGRFVLVDAGEDSDYPADMPWLAYPGWEDYVLDYVKRVAGGKLDFVMGTHAHSDHIGGFDTLIADPGVTIGQAYLKRYDNTRKQSYERISWDNEQNYGQMVSALETRGVPIVEEAAPVPFTWGNFTLTVFNGEDRKDSGDENDASFGILAESGGRRAFLAGDINNFSGEENRLRGQIGKVDLLKAGHHGYIGSTTLAFATALRPDAVVFNNYAMKVYPTVKCRLISVSNTKRLIAACSFGGVAAVFNNGEINYYAIGEYPEKQKPRAY